MLTTEDEAKTKRCFQSFPAATMISEGGHTYATSWVSPPSAGAAAPVHTAPRMCIASACMAWRWGKLINVYTPVPNTPNEFIQTDEVGGYCGLAGRPPQMDKES